MAGRETAGRSRRSGRDSPGGPPRQDDAGERPGDPESAARLICLRLLTFSPRTRAQLAEALAKRGIPAESAAVVLDRFSDVGIIDDVAFSRAWVSSRHAGRGLAGRALGRELRQRGVDPEVAADAVAELDPDDERATATALVRRRARQLSGVPPEVATRRLLSLLARKGYSAGVAYPIVRAELTARGSPIPDEQAPE